VSTEHKPSVNTASIILGVASYILQGLCSGIYPKSMYWQYLWANGNATWLQPQSQNDRQQSNYNFVRCTLCHPQPVVRLLSIIEVLATFTGNIFNVDVTSPDNAGQQIVNRASTEHQLSINWASIEYQQSINRASTILGVASCIIQGLCYGIYP